MRKRNKFLIAVLFTILLVSLVSGCSTSQSNMMGSNDQMMKMINQDPDKMADAMGSSDTRKSMVKIMSSDKMRPAMQDMMKTPEMQKSMVKIMSDPSMKETMIKIMADPAVKQQLLTMLKDPSLKPIAQEAAK